MDERRQKEIERINNRNLEKTVSAHRGQGVERLRAEIQKDGTTRYSYVSTEEHRKQNNH